MFQKSQLILIILKHLGRAAFFLAAAIVIVFILSRQISDIGGGLAEKNKPLAILERKSETVAELRQDIKIIGDNQKKLENAFPPADNILEFVETLERSAAKNFLKQTYKFGTPVQFSTDPKNNIVVSAVDYNLNLNSDIDNLINYLKLFETSPYFSTISSINISAQTTDGWKKSSYITAQAKLYVK